MPSRLTIKQRIQNAEDRKEETLNITFNFDEIYSMMEKLEIKETHGTDDLAGAIVERVCKK